MELPIAFYEDETSTWSHAVRQLRAELALKIWDFSGDGVANGGTTREFRDRLRIESKEQVDKLYIKGTVTLPASARPLLQKHLQRYAEFEITGRLEGEPIYRRRPARTAADGRRLVVSGALVVLGIAAALVYLFLSMPWAAVLFGALGVTVAVGFVALCYWAYDEFFIGIDFADEWAAFIGTVFAFMVACGVGYYYASRGVSGDGSNLREWGSYFLFGAAIGPALLALLAALVAGVLTAFRGRAPFPSLPDSAIVVALADVWLLAANVDAWSTLGIKPQLMDRLEYAAWAAEIGLPQYLRNPLPSLNRPPLNPSDPGTDAWADGQATRIAASLRRLKQWVWTPRSDTPVNFQRTVALLLESAAHGAWDDLIRGDEEVGPEPAGVWSRLRQPIAGVLPLLISLALAQTGVLSGVAVAPVLIFTGSLAFIVVLRMIDPGVVADFARASDLGKAFTPSRKT